MASSGGQSSLALMADWWLAQGKLVRFVDYYLGSPIKPLELFLEIAP